MNQETDNKNAEAAEPAKAPARSHKKKIFFIVLLTVLAAAGVAYYVITRGHVSTDDAFVDGHIYTVTPRVSGYVTQVLVDDNQAVKKGQVMVILDSVDYEVSVAQAKATLAEAEATLTSLELGVPLELSQTEQRVRAAEAQLAVAQRTVEAASKEEQAAKQDLKNAEVNSQQAQLDLHRTQALKKSESVSQSSLDLARTRYDASVAQVNAAKDKRDSAAKRRESLHAELESARANIKLAATGEDQATIRARLVEAQKARANLAKETIRQAELNLGYTKIVAPVDGHITKKNVEAGRMVSAGQPLLAVVPLDTKELWVTANYKETDLTDVRPGQPVSIEVDTYPDLKIEGRVDSIMAGTGAAFSLFPPENASGNYVKVVQRIPVKIVFDDHEGSQNRLLRIGMSVISTIHTDKAIVNRRK